VAWGAFYKAASGAYRWFHRSRIFTAVGDRHAYLSHRFVAFLAAETLVAKPTHAAFAAQLAFCEYGGERALDPRFFAVRDDAFSISQWLHLQSARPPKKLLDNRSRTELEG